MKPILVSLLLTLGLFVLPAIAQEQHKVDAGKTNFGAVTLDAFNKRVEDVAAGYLKQYPPGAISRIVLFDSAFPLDEAEYKASGGYGVLMVSALSRDQGELPLASVYIDGSKLKFIGGISREVAPDSLAHAAFGAFRTDSFWLVPAALFRSDAVITADFARNRMGFTVGNGLPAPAFRTANANSEKPDFGILKKLVAREYPGFGIEILP
jgi:hypothetical protein